MCGKFICPVCGKSLVYSITNNVDFVGEGVSIFAFSCKCGFKGVDVFPEKEHGPRTLTFKVNEDKDLNVLVARSSTSTVIIPELPLEIKPGPASQGIITTVEGILLRVKDVFGKRTTKVNELLLKKNFTLIIHDPKGTSAIDSPKVKIDAVNDKYPFKA